MATAGADRQVPHTDRAHLGEGLRVTPDLEKLLAPHVSAGKRELDTGIDIPIGGYVASGVPGTTGEPVQDRIIRSGRWGTEGRDVPDHALIVEDLPQRAGRDPQRQDRRVAVHLRRDRGVDRHLDTELRRQRLDSGVVSHVLPHEDVRDRHLQPLRFQEADGVQRPAQRTPNLRDRVMHIGPV